MSDLKVNFCNRNLDIIYYVVYFFLFLEKNTAINPVRSKISKTASRQCCRALKIDRKALCFLGSQIKIGLQALSYWSWRKKLQKWSSWRKKKGIIGRITFLGTSKLSFGGVLCWYKSCAKGREIMSNR